MSIFWIVLIAAVAAPLLLVLALALWIFLNRHYHQGPMSDRQSLILAHLADGPQTVAELVELTGLERSAISQELTAMKNAGLAHSGRGGWRLTDGAPGKPRRHEAVDPPEAPGAAADRASARKRMREFQSARVP